MRLLKNVFFTICLVLLSQCATLGERTVSMNTSQLQQKLNSKLAKPVTLLRVFHIQFSNALVSLEPGAGRIHALMDTSIRSDLLAETATGKLGLSGLLKFDPARNAVVLEQPAVDSLVLDGTSQQWSGLAQQLARDLGSKWLNQIVLYEVKPEDLTHGSTHYQPSDLKVTADGIQVTLKPQ